MNGTSEADKNWAGNVTYAAAAIERPTSLDELCALVRQHPRVRPLGTRHSFNRIADTEGVLLDMTAFQAIAEPDPLTRTVTIGGGVRYGELATFLHARGWALANLASLPHISVAGAVATATHGSGRLHQNLSASVTSLTFVTASGETVTSTEVRRDAVHLGALGPVVSLSVRIEPTYEVAQWVVEGVSMRWAAENWQTLAEAGDSVSLFSTWRSIDSFDQVWVKSRWPASPPNLPGRLREESVHPIAELPAEPCTPQCGEPGLWHERWPHFRLSHTPSAGEELQSEYFVAFEDGPAALAQLATIATDIAPALYVSEVRFVAADELWLSPAYQRDVVGIHFTWQPDAGAMTRARLLVEDALRPFGPIPHWGKIFSPELARGYLRLADFIAHAIALDPQGKFRNPFLRRLGFP